MYMDSKTQEFLQKLKDSGNWNDDYDYSNLVYKKNTSKEVLIDLRNSTKHLISPKALLNGFSCNINNAIDKTNYAILDFKKVHGEKYNYLKFIYKSSKEKSIIICDIHGEFYQSHSSHKQGFGCVKCGREKTIKGSQLNQKNVVDRLKSIHGDKYDYSRVKFEKTTLKVEIIDKEYNTIHLIAPNKIFSKKTKCTIQNAINPSEYFIKKAKSIHGNKFNYFRTEYLSKVKLISISCQTHGEFQTLSGFHYKKNGGCRKCANNQSLTKNELLKAFNYVHDNKYDYSLVEGNPSSKDFIEIICPKHGVFNQRVTNHREGRGCRTCNSGWNIERVTEFINDIRNQDVLTMDPVELNMLIAQGKLPKELEELVFTLDGTGDNSLKSLKEKLGIVDGVENNEDELQRIDEEFQKQHIWKC